MKLDLYVPCEPQKYCTMGPDPRAPPDTKCPCEWPAVLLKIWSLLCTMVDGAQRSSVLCTVAVVHNIGSTNSHTQTDGMKSITSTAHALMREVIMTLNLTTFSRLK